MIAWQRSMESSQDEIEHTTLKENKDMYRCFIAVQGLDHASLPVEFGGVKFTVFDNEQMQQFRDAISRHLVDKMYT